MSTFESFLLNSGVEEEMRDRTGIEIIDVLQIVESVVESFKSQGDPLNTTLKKSILELISSFEFF